MHFRSILKEVLPIPYGLRLAKSIINGLFICTLISENQGLEKSRSASNLRIISVPANLDFFLGLHLEKKLDLYHKPEKNPGDKLKKNPGVQDLKFF